jgi:hypothetical protein
MEQEAVICSCRADGMGAPAHTTHGRYCKQRPATLEPERLRWRHLTLPPNAVVTSWPRHCHTRRACRRSVRGAGPGGSAARSEARSTPGRASIEGGYSAVASALTAQRRPRGSETQRGRRSTSVGPIR